MEASTSNTPPRLHRANRPLQLPTVCVNDQQQQHQNLNNNFTAAMVAAISAAAAQSPLTSPVFINTNNEMITSIGPSTSTTLSTQTFHGLPQPSITTPSSQQQQQQQQLQDLHAFRLASGGATSAMLHERWFSDYRHERTSSSSSDSGIIFQFSPPGAASHLGPCPSSASLSISPPGLSPLQLDSAFSTPTPTSSNRFRSHFTFDHVMSPVRRKNDPSATFDLSSPMFAVAAAAAAANLQQQQQQTSAAVLNEIMKRASTASTSSSGLGTSSSLSTTTDFEEELKRKQEELVANASVTNSLFQSPMKSPVFRTESLPAVRFPLQSEMEKMMQTFYSNQPQQPQPQPQFLQRSPVVRTSSLNVSSPPFFQPLPSLNQQLRPSFGSAQSAFRAPSTFVTQQQQQQQLQSSAATSATLPPPPPPTILKTAPSPPQKQRKKTKSSTSPVPEEEMDETKRQYFCTTCNKDFRRPDILSRHLRRHTGEKPFGCNDCGRYFSRSDHLRTHRRTHTDEKPYKCTVCSYAARRRDVLTRHMSTRHQQKAERTFFPRQRRCISESLNKPSSSASTSKTTIKMENIKQECPSEILTSPKQRQRYSTEIKTEILETDPEDQDPEAEEEDEIIDVLNIEDDVVIDDEENVGGVVAKIENDEDRVVT